MTLCESLATPDLLAAWDLIIEETGRRSQWGNPPSSVASWLGDAWLRKEAKEEIAARLEALSLRELRDLKSLLAIPGAPSQELAARVA
jgi:hypothetical protein